MSPSFIRANERYAWHGQSLLVTNARGDCAADNALSGYYFREARHLRTLRLAINGEEPWLCDSATSDPESLHFSYVHPELAEFGGGGTGYSQDQTSRDAQGIPHRSLDLLLDYRLGIASLDVTLAITNRAREIVHLDLAWILDADFADIQEGFGKREQSAAVSVTPGDAKLEFTYEHERLPYRTIVTGHGDADWRAERSGLTSRLTLETQ